MNYSKNRTLISTAVLVTLLLCFLFDSRSGLFNCPFYALTDFECPGCGLQRSLVFLLQADISASIQMYWATAPILILFAYCFLFLKYKYRNGLKTMLYLFCFTAALIIGNYIYKITYYL